MNDAPVIVEQTFAAPADLVWQAITDKEKMKNWYFDLERSKPETGFEFQFTGGSEEKQYLHLCRITEVVDRKKLSYSWKYEGYPGESLVTFDLFNEGDKTRLKLTHEGLESFPADNPDMAKESFMQGWNQIIRANLKEFVESVDKKS
jgi:uncharacterized protein YndB with AHSA1/START domain